MASQSISMARWYGISRVSRPALLISARSPRHQLPVAFAGSELAAAPATPQLMSTRRPSVLEQTFRSEQPGLLEALSSATAAMTPATAAQLVRHLEAELPPVLSELAPGGDCVLVAIQPGLLPLLEHAVDCCEQALQSGHLHAAIDTAKAALSLLSRLHFGGRQSAEPYSAVAVRCKQALKAAFDAGAPIYQEDIVELQTACARASGWLWLTPYFGHRCACAVDGFITAGWASAELAVRATEAHAALTAAGRYSQVPRTHIRLVEAAVKHPLSLGQVDRLLAASHSLPVEMSIQLEMISRAGGSHWHDRLLQLRQREQQRHNLQLAMAKQASSIAAIGNCLDGRRPRFLRPTAHPAATSKHQA